MTEELTRDIRVGQSYSALHGDAFVEYDIAVRRQPRAAQSIVLFTILRRPRGQRGARAVQGAADVRAAEQHAGRAERPVEPHVPAHFHAVADQRVAAAVLCYLGGVRDDLVQLGVRAAQVTPDSRVRQQHGPEEPRAGQLDSLGGHQRVAAEPGHAAPVQEQQADLGVVEDERPGVEVAGGQLQRQAHDGRLEVQLPGKRDVTQPHAPGRQLLVQEQIAQHLGPEHRPGTRPVRAELLSGQHRADHIGLGSFQLPA